MRLGRVFKRWGLHACENIREGRVTSRSERSLRRQLDPGRLPQYEAVSLSGLECMPSRLVVWVARKTAPTDLART